jgi:hypothetical protein
LEQESDYPVRRRETPAEHSVYGSMLRRRLMGCLMKNGIATDSVPDEYYVIKIDGRMKSGHRRFIDALRESLQLKDQFPHHDVKVRAVASEHLAV